jgi:putative membrane protein
MNKADLSVGAPERLHPLYLLTGLGRGLRQMVGGYAAIGYFAATGSWRTALIILAGIVAMLVVSIILYWRRFEYRVGASEIRIDSGILNRKHRSIPFDRIQDVDITQGPVARLLGLARVEFETGGTAGQDNDDGALAAIALPRAEALREQIRARRGKPATTADAAIEAAPLFAMDLRRVLLAGLFNFSLAVIAGLFGATQTVGDVAGFDVFARSFWGKALDAGSPIADFILAHQITAALAGTVSLVLVGIGTGISRTLLREYRFRLDRTETGLRRRRGLLTLTDVTLPLRRAQAAIVGTGPLRERFGWRSLKLQSLGKDEGSKGDHVVAPLATEAEAETILAELGWHEVDPATEWRRVSPAYGWGFTIAVSLLLIPAALQFVFVPLAGIVGAAVVAALIATRWLSWRRYRYALDGDRLLVRSGWWRRRLVMLPLANIQSVDLIENVIGRRFGVAGLAIGVASGRGFSSHGIEALPRETARALRTRLLSPFE